MNTGAEVERQPRAAAGRAHDPRHRDLQEWLELDQGALELVLDGLQLAVSRGASRP